MINYFEFDKGNAYTKGYFVYRILDGRNFPPTCLLAPTCLLDYGFFPSYMFIPPYMFIKFWKMFPPACLFPPTRLLGTQE